MSVNTKYTSAGEQALCWAAIRRCAPPLLTFFCALETRVHVL